MHHTIFEGKSYRLPDFIIPGAAKSGTTTLYKLLDQHPDIYFPASRKEPFYFSFGGSQPAYADEAFNQIPIWRTAEYLNLYSDAKAPQLCGDASTSYLYMPEQSIANMQKLYGASLADVRVLIILRNPVERAYSHYTYLVRNGFETRTFDEAISAAGIENWSKKRWGFDYIKYGEYARQVSHYFNEFKEVKILLTEDLKAPQQAMNGVFQFLGLEAIEVQKDLNANPSGIPKNKGAINILRKNKLLKGLVGMLPQKTRQRALHMRDKTMEKFLEKTPMPDSAKRMLEDHFSKDIGELSKLINRDLGHWLRKP